MKTPFIAAAEDFLGIIGVWRVLRGCGAFFLRRKPRPDDELYKIILKEYLQRILIDGHSLEFFIEGTRSRTGKLLNPKFGLLKYVADGYFNKRIEDVYLCPITINYEKILEGASYPRELLGLPKIKESFVRIIKATSTFFCDYGRIFMNFHEPISLKQYINRQMAVEKAKGKVMDPFSDNNAKKYFLNKLGHEIVWSLNKSLVIMPTAIVATILLLHRKGISEDLLVSQT
jgi:glycerone phosphate O-acyltransferase/fatty acyl-CoA reductase